jgi:hypothetical protein
VFPNHANAWREVLQRIFSEFSAQENVTPDWLVNPETSRRLKLDRYYPEAGIAFRFTGSVGKRKAPISEQEIEEEANRDAIREQLCRDAGVTLVSIDLYGGDPAAVLRDVRSALSRSARLLAQGSEPQKIKADRARRLSKAKQMCDSLALRLRSAGDLALYAELWEDRQYATTPDEAESPPAKAKALVYSVGMRVEHERFGAGTVAGIRQEKSGELVTVQFDDESQRTFAVSLVQSKLTPLR